MNISKIGASSIQMNQNQFQKTESNNSGESFSNVLSGYLQNVDNTVKQAEVLSTQLATGEVENVHDVMIASEKAKLALELTVTIRDKAVEAYHEVMRMQM
ncbi:MAG: flagellar hook-basal body complex protein FliE [Bacillales bacterium]|jgi:flagellar hook-basal body complex protein FliE|nr:flagellar hook-basal body complex protein FliE [Bacillales bacterium]